MNVPPPSNVYSGDTWAIPPERYTLVRAVVGPGSGDVYDAPVAFRGTAVSFASGVFLVRDTNICDPGTGLDYRILEGVKFSQLKIGWVNTHWDGSAFTYTDHEDDLTTSTMHFDWQDISTPPYDYKHSFRVWRVEG